MTKYILHGGATRLENNLNKKYFSEIANSLQDEDILLMCYFAPSMSSNRTEKEKFDQYLKIFRKYIPKDIKYVFAEHGNFIEQLKKADALYMHGGGTNELFETLKKYPDFAQEVKKKKVIIGSSAGAYALAKYSIDYAEGSEPLQGFGILPIKIFCHFEDRLRNTLVEKFRKVDKSGKWELVLLRDCEMRIFKK
jgi:peptidase E